VLDEDGSFRSRCNLSMVDLEPVEEEENLSQTHYHAGGDMETKGKIDILSNMASHDEERLVKLVREHLRHTGSARAAHILDNWAEYRPKFVKVMPVEYRRALQEMEETQRLMAAE
jgi:glutamate synthase (NADPH) large chain